MVHSVEITDIKTMNSFSVKVFTDIHDFFPPTYLILVGFYILLLTDNINKAIIFSGKWCLSLMR